MLKRNLFILATIVLVATILLGACQQSSAPFECTDAIGCVSIAPDEPVKLGVIQDLSGGAVLIGTEQVNSIELALARREKQLLGHPITIQLEDTGCSAEGGSVATAKLAADPRVLAILGTTCSGAAVTASKVISKAGLVMVSGANSAPSLTQAGGKKGDDWQLGYFRTRHNDSTMGQAAAVFTFQELGITRVATINDGDPYTKGLTEVFKQTFTDLGGEIVLDATINKGETDMKPVLTAVVDHEAGLVFIPLFLPEAVSIVQQSKEMDDMQDVILMGATVLGTDPFIQAVHTDGVGMYFVSTVGLENQANDELAATYEATYGQPPLGSLHLCAYDSVNLLLHAMETIAVQEEDGTLHIGRQALRDALYATSGFEGVSGTLSCDEFGDCGVGRFGILRLDDPEAGVEGMWSNVIYTYAPGQ